MASAQTLLDRPVRRAGRVEDLARLKLALRSERNTGLPSRSDMVGVVQSIDDWYWRAAKVWGVGPHDRKSMGWL